MKTFRLALVLSLLVGTNALASHTNDSSNVTIFDHNGGCNLRAAMNHAYSLADIGERYDRAYDYQFASAANALHHAATDLYYALRNRVWGANRYDHNEGGTGILNQLADQVGYQVNNFVYYAPYDIANWTKSLYYNLRNNLRC